MNDRRKDAIRNSINPMYLSLLNYDKSPSFEWLLGDDIDAEMDELDKVKKQSERLVKPKSNPNQNANFRRRGRPNSDNSNVPRESRAQSNSDRRETSSREGSTVRYNQRREYSNENSDFSRRQPQNQNYRGYYSNRRRY